MLSSIADPPRKGSLRIRGELNREDIEGRKRRTSKDGRERTEDGGNSSSVLSLHSSVLPDDLILHSSDLPTYAPGRLDRVLEALA